VTPVLTSTGRLRAEADLDAVLSTIARDAIDVVGGPDADRLRRCANGRCTRLYVDASRAGNRRWCGMAECGNAAKVAAFRARRQA
jgi:predicted RNA-binding Zn ribbon-like protein